MTAIIGGANNVAPALAFGGTSNPFQPNSFVLPSVGTLPQPGVSAHPLTMGREEERFDKTRNGLNFDDLLKGWASEKQPREKTR